MSLPCSAKCAAALLLGTITAASAPKTNILFIAVDDLRPAIGCYGDGHAITPNLDRLAKRGVRFDQAHCQVAVCNPSRASLMTGQRPDTLGVWTLPIHFREAKPNVVTLPQWLRRHGYTAVGHGKIYHNPTPDPQSWSEPIRPIQFQRGYAKGWQARIREVQAKLPDNDWRKNNLRGPATAAPVIDDHQLVDGARTNMAIEDLRRLGQAEKPFFLALGFIRPHLAWISPKKYWDLYDPKTLPVIIDGEVTPNTPPYALSTSYELTHYMDFIDFPKPWDEQGIRRSGAPLMHAYYASVSYIDAQLGRLLAALDDAGLAGNTIIVLWSDHGWKLGEYNGWGKMSNYEIDTRVPFIIAAPGMKTAGQSTDTPVELDMFPTLCDMAGIPTPDFVQGTSLLPLLQNPAAKIDRVAHSQYYRNHDSAEYMGYAMRTATHRFVEWREFGTGKVTARELYDHRQNHSETANVIDTAPEALVESLTSRLLKTHPRRPLQMVPSVHSNPNRGRQPAPLLIANKTDTEIKVYAITPRGQRSRRPTVVKPGDRTEINARIGGVFVVESRDGTIHEIHSPSLPGRTINIERP